MNILTTDGLLSRVAGEWAGHTRLTRLVTRLRVPAYPHTELVLDGVVVAVGGGTAELAVRAATGVGAHAEATAHVGFGEE